MVKQNFFRGINVNVVNFHPIRLTAEGQSVLAAGPRTKQPDTMEYEIVLLRHKDDSFSVHSEIFEGTKSYLVSGNYYPPGPKGFEKACKKFGETIANQAGFYSTIFAKPQGSVETGYMVVDNFKGENHNG